MADTHLIHPGDGITSCCNRPPFELPLTDRITGTRGSETCTASADAQRVIDDVLREREERRWQRRGGSDG